VTTPPWLREHQEYSTRSDRDGFIDRSAKSLLRVLSWLRPGEEPAGRRRLVDTRVKLVTLLCFLLLVSLSHGMSFVLLAAVLLLVLLAVQPAEIILEVLIVGLPSAGFTLLILLPYALSGDVLGATRIVVKVFVCVAGTRLLSATTAWSHMTRGLAAFRVPDVFILVLDIAFLFAGLLGDVSLAMMNALKLRSVGRNARKTASLSGIAGTLFLKSRSMAEGLYAAMECRCFTGTYRRGRAGRLHPGDYAVLAGDAFLVAAFVLSGS
jgi:cobalt/nickel transport system permease protein